MKKKKQAQRKPTPIDLHVAERIKLKRRSLGIKQLEIAEKLGISFQGYQRYECGLARISAGRLYEISRILNESVEFFFAILEKILKLKNQSVIMKS